MNHKCKIIFLVILMTFISIVCFAATIGLRWDANDPEPEGYRIFTRVDGQSYDYDNPTVCKDLETGDIPSSMTSVSIDTLSYDVHYYFVVRAFEGDLESADSNEVDVILTASLVIPTGVIAEVIEE